MIARSAEIFGGTLSLDHAEAMIENAEFDARSMTATRTAIESPLLSLAELADTINDPELSSAEIAWTAINAVRVAYDLTIPQAIARLVDVDFRAYSPKAVVV